METSLFDGQGNAIAYAEDEPEIIIRRWSGAALAFVKDENVFAWNGQHLGWYAEGVLYDLKGLRVGSIKEKCPMATYAEPSKYKKHERSRRMPAKPAAARPALSANYSNGNFEDFLRGL